MSSPIGSLQPSFLASTVLGFTEAIDLGRIACVSRAFRAAVEKKRGWFFQELQEHPHLRFLAERCSAVKNGATATAKLRALMRHLKIASDIHDEYSNRSARLLDWPAPVFPLDRVSDEKMEYGTLVSRIDYNDLFLSALMEQDLEQLKTFDPDFIARDRNLEAFYGRNHQIPYGAKRALQKRSRPLLGLHVESFGNPFKKKTTLSCNDPKAPRGAGYSPREFDSFEKATSSYGSSEKRAQRADSFFSQEEETSRLDLFFWCELKKGMLVL